MDVRQHILERLGAAAGVEATQEDLADSPLADYGSPVAFKLAKKLKTSPAQIAQEIAARIKPTELIEKVEAVNGYVNFSLKRGEYTRRIIEDVRKQGSEYGSGKRKGKIILEHTSVNPTGPVHVGRLRNTIIGDSLRRILSFAGCEVETHYYVNDIGKQIAIIAAGRAESVEPSAEVEAEYSRHMGKKDFRMFSIYVPAYARFEEDVGFQDKVQKLIQDAESGEKAALKKITDTARECLEGQADTFSRLGVRFDVFDYESKYITDGSVGKLIEAVRKSKHARETDIGFGVDLSEFGIEKQGGMTVLLRKDGTSVYLTRDLAYHLDKARLVSKGGRLINVLGEDHKLEFKELKTILAQVLGFTTPLDAVHFSFVSFEGEKFSTRRGKIAAVDVLLDEAVEKALDEVRKRKIGDESIAPAVGIGAVKFHIIKTQPNKQITFSWKDALDFEGETAPYVQYAHARSCRILEKAGEWKPEGYDPKPENEEEWQLIRQLASFPEAVNKAVEELRPDIIAAHMLSLTAAYGRFYMKCPVLESGEKTRPRRLLLVQAVRDVVKTGLDLLGILAPERM